jgi:hypothetical protein
MIGPKKMKDGCWMMSGLPVAMCGNSSVDNWSGSPPCKR